MELFNLSRKIPDGWQQSSVGHLIIEQPKSCFNVSDASDFGAYPFFTSGELILRHNRMLVDGENLYLADGGVADIKYYDGESSYSNHTYTIQTTNEIDTKFLYYCLVSIREYINNFYFQGTGLKNLQKKDFKKHEICFPKDKEEQKRIAAVLTQLDEGIAKTKSLIDKYLNIKQGVMQDLLTKGFDEYNNIRSETMHKFKDSEIGRIPEEWECTSLGNLFDFVSGITPSRSNHAYFDNNGMNWVKTLDLNENYLFSTEEKISEIALKETSIRVHPSGTLLMAMYGGWIQIGRTAILKNPATTNQAILAFYPKEATTVPIEYVQMFLQTYKHKWKRCAISTRKDPNISQKDVSEFCIAYPKQVNEANAIVERIKLLQNTILSQDALLRKLENVRSGLLRDLLSGNVRIPSTIKL